MTDEVNTGEQRRSRVPDEALARLHALLDPDLDDLTRGLQARVALSHMGGPAMLIDLDGTVLEVNEEMESLADGRGPRQGRALWHSAIWGTADVASILIPLVESATGGKVGARTLDLLAGDGAARPFRLGMTPIADRDGDVTVVLAELRDLADRAEAEALLAATTQALTAAEDIFRAMAENTSDLVCLHQPDGTFTYLSPSLRKLLDLAPDDLVGTHPVDHVHPDTRDMLVNALNDA
ncbi:MAG: PAS domain S-box protein, partial [Acidimicrobiales bacterium]